MRVSCILTNHNYGKFVCEAISSARGQTRPFDEIIVVDDASTDDSCARIQNEHGDAVTFLPNSVNEGQLAAIDMGYKSSTGDIVCLLDADDVYRPNYLERVLAAYDRAPRPDFVFCAYSKFGEVSGVAKTWPGDRDLGQSVLRTYFRRQWLGGPTSTLSLRRWVFDSIGPMFRPGDWQTRADDCVVFASSFSGACKRYLAEPLVEYRVHGNNEYHGRTKSARERYDHEFRHARLATIASKTLEIDFEYLSAYVYREFATIPEPDLSDFRDYLYIALRRPRICKSRVRILTAIISHYFKNRRRGAFS